MSDEELLAQAPNLPVLFYDGFGAYRLINGLLRCVGYNFDIGAQHNLVISLAGAEAANVAVRTTLDQKATQAIKIWNGTTLAH